MSEQNPFKLLDHVTEESEGLRERVVRSAERQKGILAIAGMFSGDFMKSIFGLAGGKPDKRDSTKKGDRSI